MLKTGYYLFRFFCLLSFRRIPFSHFGTHYGGWKIPNEAIDRLKNVISAGVGEDISFEVSLVQANNNVAVHLFDPTPPGINHFENFTAASEANQSFLINSGWKKHPNDQLNEAYPQLSSRQKERLHFYPLGLDRYPSRLKFSQPMDARLSYSAEVHSDTPFILCDCQPISELLTSPLKLSREDFQLLKMDIEGSEYGVIHDMMEHKIFPELIIFEIHMFRLKNIIGGLRSVIQLLFRGYRCYFMDGNNYGFIKSLKIN